MFGVQWEQTVDGKADTGNMDIRGKKVGTTQLQDQLTGMLIGLARATEGNDHMVSESTSAVLIEGLFAALINVNFDDDMLLGIMKRVEDEKRKLVPECFNCLSSCGRNNDYDMSKLWKANEDIRSLKTEILLGIRGITAYAYQAAASGCKEESIHKFLYKALFAVGMDDWGREELYPIVLEANEMNRKCMTMLDKGKTEIFDHPN